LDLRKFTFNKDCLKKLIKTDLLKNLFEFYKTLLLTLVKNINIFDTCKIYYSKKLLLLKIN